MSASAHTVLRVQQFLTKNGMTAMPHPPYSPDLAPSNFFFVSQMKKLLRGKRFASVEDVKQNTVEALKGIKFTSSKTV